MRAAELCARSDIPSDCPISKQTGGKKSNLYSRHSYVSLIKYFIEDNRIKFLFPYATEIIVRNEKIILVEKKKKSNSRRV